MAFRLSYESVVLDSDDLEILETEQWFNDTILTFVGEYLMKSVNTEENRKIHVFTPPETEILRYCGSNEEAELYFGMLGVKEVPLIAFIVCNNTNPDRAFGGSHWSLLVFEREKQKFHHFDSSHRLNEPFALEIADKSAALVGVPQFFELSLDANALQQTNGRDCGLYVAQFLWTLAVTNDVDAVGKLENIEKDRKFWRDLIVELAGK